MTNIYLHNVEDISLYNEKLSTGNDCLTVDYSRKGDDCGSICFFMVDKIETVRLLKGLVECLEQEMEELSE